MKEAAFQELLKSVRQAGRIRRGRLKASRTRVFRPADVKAVRVKLGTSQSEFALMIGVSVATLRKLGAGPSYTRRAGACVAASRGGASRRRRGSTARQTRCGLTLRLHPSAAAS